ncbi:hypothetical protein TTHERM_000051839 (macronuclear) [Tetrahymena thermophila SB210]|uniref:Uncharacterized protein n=1 Tax=Tetrahymena thermophila (strain SB210) TaxID=312017 RepID=W7X5I9_TETTS|nr:hypothetical protein TTHERM_000051839 [Tetrahymena thermophila SB210]EWS74635.1 hypothetical protein TTHERM_000051839 [Tetrahymena thermophila SB210]|eukprot:XP_012652857.1 hypothetical protein TTHERM_000051839 [Tetrahymena thermophila SB210]
MKFLTINIQKDKFIFQSIKQLKQESSLFLQKKKVKIEYFQSIFQKSNTFQINQTNLEKTKVHKNYSYINYHSIQISNDVKKAIRQRFNSKQELQQKCDKLNRIQQFFYFMYNKMNNTIEFFKQQLQKGKENKLIKFKLCIEETKYQLINPKVLSQRSEDVFIRKSIQIKFQLQHLLLKILLMTSSEASKLSLFKTNYISPYQHKSNQIRQFNFLI